MSKFIVHIENSEITNKKIVSAAFKCLPDGAYLVDIELRRRIRTLPQNNYYHGIMVPLVKEGLQEVGYNNIRTHEQAHNVLKMLFLKREHVQESTGMVIEEIGSTTNLSTVQFSEYIESIIQWAAENLGIVIPLPNEQVKLNFDEEAKRGSTS